MKAKKVPLKSVKSIMSFLPSSIPFVFLSFFKVKSGGIEEVIFQGHALALSNAESAFHFHFKTKQPPYLLLAVFGTYTHERNSHSRGNVIPNMKTMTPPKKDIRK